MKKTLSRIMVLVLIISLMPIQMNYAQDDIGVPYEGYIVSVSDTANIDEEIEAEELSKDIFLVDNKSDAKNLVDDSTDIEYIEPNYEAELLDFPYSEPNDPLYAESTSTYQWNLHMVGADEFWKSGNRGSNVKVCILDTGLNVAHEDFEGSTILQGYNYSLYSENGLENNDVTDMRGHGTLVSSIINATTNNSKGIAGMCDKVSLIPIKVFYSSKGNVANIIRGLDQAISLNCDVINISLATTADTKSMKQLIDKALGKGIVVVAAAGNDGDKVSQPLNYPAAYDGVIGVGSVNKKGFVSSFSQKNESIFITAPGENIPGLGIDSDNEYVKDSGTSFSSPMVASVAVATKSVNKNITAAGIKYLLKESATDKGRAGWDIEYGHGILNITDYVSLLNSDYKIKYVVNGGVFQGSYAKSYNVASNGATLPTNLTRKNMKFDGWYANIDFSGGEIQRIAPGEVGDKTYYAKWVYDSTDAPVYEIFDDVGKDNWYTDAVQYVYDAALFSGTSDDKFSPNMTMERGMYSTVLGRDDKINPADYPTTSFKDVSTTDYFAPYVEWAYIEDIISGVGDSEFAPRNAVTREQITVMAYNFANYRGISTSGSSLPSDTFRDIDKISTWAKDATAWALDVGLLAGKPGGYIDPKGKASRAEVATMMVRLDSILYNM